MKETKMPPVHAANPVIKSDNIAYGVESICLRSNTVSNIGFITVHRLINDGHNAPDTLAEFQLMIRQHWSLVPPGNKLLPEPMLTHIYVALWCH